MVKRIIAGMFIAFYFCLTARSQSEFIDVGVPFLVITSSPESNGMGGITTLNSVINAFAPIFNPGHLGNLALDNYLTAGTYISKTQWLSNFPITVCAVNLGLSLNRMTSLPFPVSVGIGYASTSEEFGKYIFPNPNGSPQPDTVIAIDNAENFSFGVGFDYYARVGFGITTKRVESTSADFDITGTLQPIHARLSVIDFGVFMNVPVVEIISKLRDKPLKLSDGISPSFDITSGYARRNIGEKLQYDKSMLAWALPRTAMLGISWKLGLDAQTPTDKWDILSFTLAREAEASLSHIYYIIDTNFNVSTEITYDGGNGDIQFFKNLFRGERNGQVFLRKGWQVNIGEIVYIRGGSVEGPYQSYSTDGYGIRLSGIAKLIRWIKPQSEDIIDLSLRHVDFEFNHSHYSDPVSILDGTTFNGLNFIIK